LSWRRAFVLDTSVIAEYLDESSPYGVERLFDALAAGAARAYVTPVTLSEVVYVAARIYSEAGVRDPNARAVELAEWLLALPGVALEPIGREAALAAGELRKRFRMALPDLYVIAVGALRGAIPLFLKLEGEMEPYEGELRRLGVAFWEELRHQLP
jgi:predicted nucleic acid-binding protein